MSDEDLTPVSMNPHSPYGHLPLGRRADLVYLYPQLALFRSTHLPPDLQLMSNCFAALAWTLADLVPEDSRAVGQAQRALDTVWDAKNRAVMALVLAKGASDPVPTDDSVSEEDA